MTWEHSLIWHTVVDGLPEGAAVPDGLVVGGLLEVVTVVDGLVVVSGTWIAWQLQKLNQIINDAITATLDYKLVVATDICTCSLITYLLFNHSTVELGFTPLLHHGSAVLLWYFLLFPTA